MYKNKKSTNALFKIYIYYELGNLYFVQKDYTKAIDNLLIALSEAEKIDNKILLKEIKHKLSICYLTINDKVLCKQYNKEVSDVIMTIEDMEVEAVNTFYGLIGEEQEAFYNVQKDKYWNYTYFGIAILGIILLFWGGLYYVNKLRKRRLKEIMSYLELIKNTAAIKPQTDTRETHKRLVIPTETEQHILAKLKKFEASTKYTHKDMSLANLAAQMDINTKYLSEIINKHYQDNFNTYINKLRINYIIEKLKNSPEYLHYKISYLAEESGFSSHSSFATVFKSITGIAPTTFIDLMGEEVKDKQKVS
jgi:YesN/AraC family two-component response regulator